MSIEKLLFPDSLREQIEPYLPRHGPRTHEAEFWDAFFVRGDLNIHVTLTYAQSLDSRIALAHGRPTAISGPLSKAMTHYLRTRHDAILIGSGTAIADDPTLNTRLEGATYHLQPQPVIIDRHCRWEFTEDSKVVRAARDGRGRPPWIIKDAKSSPSETNIRALEYCGGKYIDVEIGWYPDVLRRLLGLGIRSVMVEGGAATINTLLTQNIAILDSVMVTVAPIYLGKDGVQVAPELSALQRDQHGAGILFQDSIWVPVGVDVIMCARPLKTKDIIRSPVTGG